MPNYCPIPPGICGIHLGSMGEGKVHQDMDNHPREIVREEFKKLCCICNRYFLSYIYEEFIVQNNLDQKILLF